MENRNETGSDCQHNTTNESAEVLLRVGEVQTFKVSKDDDQYAPSWRSALPVAATEEECRHVTVQRTADEKYKLVVSNPQNNNEVAICS